MKKYIISGLLSCSLLLSGLIAENKAEASTVGEKAIDAAFDYIGVPYVWGGTTPSGFDCSGFINYAYKQAGLTLPRTTSDLYNKGQSISKGSLKEGDLVFFTTYKAGPSHAGIYIGNNEFIHASSSKGVSVDSLTSSYWSNTYYGAKRIDNVQSGWVLTNGTWYYYDNGVMKTGWVYTGGKWYFLDSNGAMKTGWVYTGNKWYYLENSGAMKTSWLFWNGKWYHLSGSGAMSTGWVLSSGKWYYLYQDGSMAVSTTIDGYVVDSTGAWVQ